MTLESRRPLCRNPRTETCARIWDTSDLVKAKQKILKSAETNWPTALLGVRNEGYTTCIQRNDE